jgi:excisionase family DNA binding protein
MENQSISLTAIPEGRLQGIEAAIQEIKTAIFRNQEEEFQSQWLESEEARQKLNVSRKTWQNYRNKKVIPFSQFGRKIYVRRSDLEAFLQRNIIHK